MPEKAMTTPQYIDGRRVGHIKEQRVHRPTQRTWKADAVHSQGQSHLAGRLPAEVRNLIYAYLWGDLSAILQEEENEEEKEVANQPVIETSRGILNDGSYEEDVDTGRSHPLSLLSTCRKIYLDATLFAFSHHTFKTSMYNVVPTYLALTQLTALLSELHVNAISRLAYDLPFLYPTATNHCATYVTNSLLIFPALTYFEIHTPEVSAARAGALHGRSPVTSPEGFVPLLLSDTLDNIINGHSYMWQKGEKWSVKWPQEDDPDCIHTASMHEFSSTGFVEEGNSKRRYPGIPRRLMSPCVCGCGAPCRNSAVLCHEGGRQPVTLQLKYHNKEDGSVKPQVERITGLPEGYDFQRTIVGGSRTMAFEWNAEGTDFWKRHRAKETWSATFARWWKKREPEQVWVSETEFE
ncbi:hypothetical protein P171DRAFT_491234 [Karstenula rhodostoma CBS 690.94]|uniref:DUF7730 domain-containing protein n=1 Tax=Karstenula rhodostoma CBS 690.94 TaxID=1392251 RepID=A0A9P4U6A5_9PLEO|nr:hypothetical protein P171DRAFT_491234 [Karstenula rhodostoma CBS 690.94]